MRVENPPQRLIIPTPFPVGPVNVYLLDGPEPTLVDAGPDTEAAWTALRAGLAARGYALSAVRRLVLTHAHSDHCGLAARVVAASGARVYAHRNDVALLANEPAEITRRRDFYAQMLQKAGIPTSLVEEIQHVFASVNRHSPAIAVDVPLVDGDVLPIGEHAWEVLYTPGHAAGEICLYLRQAGYLLSGDHLLRDISSNPVLEPPWPGEQERPHSLVLYLHALERVAALEISQVFPGHGELFTNPRAVIAQRLHFHRQRATQLADALGAGPQTAYQLAQTLFPQVRGFNVFLAVSEIIGHLDILMEEGRVLARHTAAETLYVPASITSNSAPL